MASNLLTRLFRRSDDIARGMTVADYIRQVAAQFGTYMPPIASMGPTGLPTERPPQDFEGLVTQAFAANPIVYGLVTKRGLIYSEARLMWQDIADGRPGDLSWDDGLALLEKPWPNGSTGEMLMRVDQDISLAGNAYIVRDGDRLRRLRPDWVQIVLSGDPREEHDIDVVGYVYGAGSPDSGTFKPYLPDEVAHISPVPDPLAAYRGMSWLTPVIREVQADKQATEHKLSFLKNGAVLGPVVKAPPGISVEQFKRFIEAAESAHAGPSNSGKWVFLANGADVQTVSANLKDIDLKALTASAETRMTVAALMPAVIAGVSEGLQGSSLNAGNYQAAKRAFADGTLRPLWRITCAELETILDVPDGKRLWFDETGVAFLREDQQDVAGIQAQQATTINTLVTAGFKPESIVVAVRENDWSKLEHSGLTSVQLTPPGMGAPGAPAADVDGDGVPDAEAPDAAGEGAYQQALAELRAGAGGETQRSQILRADVGHSGAMIALVPSEEDAQRLAVDDGEPVDDLHLTLFYLGEAADIPADQRKPIIDAAEAAVRRRSVPVLELNAFGAALWNPGGEEPAWVLNVGDPDPRPQGQEPVAVIRRAVGDALAYGVSEFRMPRQHTPFAAHVCIAYGADTVDADELVDRTGPVVFDRLRVAFAGRVTDIPLRGRERAAPSAKAESDDDEDREGEAAYRAALARFRDDLEIERADRYSIRTPAGMRSGKSRGGQFRSLSAAVVGALESWMNGEGDDDPLEQFTQPQLRKAAAQLGVRSDGLSKPRLKLALLEKARGDVRAQRREATEGRQRMPEGYRVERLDDGRWSVQTEGGSEFAQADSIEQARGLAEADRDRRQAGRKRRDDSRLPGGGPTPPARPPVTPMTVKGKTPRKLTDAEKVADALAAGRISERTAISLLTGRPEPEGFDPDRARAFNTGMVHAGYITELAWTGDRERLEGYLRRQNTDTLQAAAPFFGLSLPSDGGHEAAVAAFADRAMQLEAPRRELPSGEELRQSLLSRKVKDLQASLRAAGLPVSGRKADLVDRLVAAYSAARGDGDDATGRPDRGAGLPSGGDGRGRGPGAARPQSADREPDAGATRPAAGAVGGGDDAGDLTGRPRLSTDPAVRAVQVENRIRQAVGEMPKAPGGWVRIADLRDVVGDVPRADFDAAVRRLGGDDDWRFVPVDNRRMLTARDREAAVRIGEDDVNVVAYTPGGRDAGAPPPLLRLPRGVTSDSPLGVGGATSTTKATKAAPAKRAPANKATAAKVQSAAELEPLYMRVRDDHRRDLSGYSTAELEALNAKLSLRSYDDPDVLGGSDPYRLDVRDAVRAELARRAATPAKKATAANALPSRPGRVSTTDSRDWTPAQHVAHAEQARRDGDNAEARLHRGLADTKNRALAESGRGVEHLRSLTDRDDARRFLRSLTRAQLDDLAGRLGVGTEGSRDAVIARILAVLPGVRDRLDAESRPGSAPLPLGTVRVTPVANLDDVRPDYVPGEWQSIDPSQLIELDARQLAARLRDERDARTARLGPSPSEWTNAQIYDYALRTSTAESAMWGSADVTFVNGPYRLQSFVGTVKAADLRRIATLVDIIAERGPLDRARIAVTSTVAGDFRATGSHIPGSAGDIQLAERVFTSAFTGSDVMPSAANASMLQYTLAHEWGHALSDYEDPDDLLAMAGTPGMSTYGQANEREAFAEAWAEWFLTAGQTTNPAARAYAQRFGWR